MIAIGGVGAFLATIILACVAGYQARQSRKQTDAMRAQVAVIRETAESEISALRDTAAQELALVREQVDTSVEQNKTLREMTSAQLRPVVFAKAFSGWVRGPNEDFDLGPHEMALPYYLANEGTGMALRIQHGVDIGGVVMAMGYGEIIYAVRPGELIERSLSTSLPSLRIPTRSHSASTSLRMCEERKTVCPRLRLLDTVAEGDHDHPTRSLAVVQVGEPKLMTARPP